MRIDDINANRPPGMMPPTRRVKPSSKPDAADRLEISAAAKQQQQAAPTKVARTDDQGSKKFYEPLNGAAKVADKSMETKMYRQQQKGNSKETQRQIDASPIRTELVEQVRQRLLAGEYDRPEVVDTVIERLLDSLSVD